MSVLDDGVVEVPVEALLDVGHILDLGVAVQYSTVQYSTVQYSTLYLSSPHVLALDLPILTATRLASFLGIVCHSMEF